MSSVPTFRFFPAKEREDSSFLTEGAVKMSLMR